jgi:uncharacterized protein YjdB
MTTTMTLIAKQTVGSGGASSVTFNNLPDSSKGYTDLKLVMSVRSDRAANGDDFSIYFNNSSSGIDGKRIFGTGANAYWSTPAASVAGSNTYIQFNDSGSLNAVSSFTFNKTTNTLSVGTGFTANNTLTNTEIEALILKTQVYWLIIRSGLRRLSAVLVIQEMRP